ncbi:ElsH Metal-dependent hydrolase [Candidatus Nanopelagicaceae bacterium]
MAIPPSQAGGTAQNRALLEAAVQSLGSDVLAMQEVDHFLPRTGMSSQTQEIAYAMSAPFWAFAPSVVGTPGEQWRKLHGDEQRLVTHENFSKESELGTYGIAIASKIPVISFNRLDLGRSPIGLPLVVPGDETGRGRPRFIYVKDEPRVALAATLNNGWTVINTHLSFAPGLNLLQLKRLKKWALKIGAETHTRVLIVGDLNLPKNLPIAASNWKSLVTRNTYPSWGSKIQFDYILTPEADLDFTVQTYAPTGVSDHLPIGVRISQ